MDDVLIRTMSAQDARGVAALADRLVGVDYYPPALVRQLIDDATTEAGVFAYVAELAEAPGRPIAFRFVKPPGRWAAGRGKGLHPERWPVGLTSAAYFQSCFVDDACTGRGIGGRLASRALDELKAAGTRCVVAHSWKESPHNSSFRYLSRLGFEPIEEIPEYWVDIDYICRLDGTPCRCTAIEMVLDLERWPAAPGGRS